MDKNQNLTEEYLRDMELQEEIIQEMMDTLHID